MSGAKKKKKKTTRLDSLLAMMLMMLWHTMILLFRNPGFQWSIVSALILSTFLNPMMSKKKYKILFWSRLRNDHTPHKCLILTRNLTHPLSSVLSFSRNDSFILLSPNRFTVSRWCSRMMKWWPRSGTYTSIVWCNILLNFVFFLFVV